MRIYVGGLSYTVDDQRLRELFAEAGNVTDAHVVEDRDSRQSKGFGFLEMPDEAEAKAAIARFNGQSIDGRELTVNEARPREERSGGGGGGRSGGGGYGGGGGRSGGGYGGGGRSGGRW